MEPDSSIIHILLIEDDEDDYLILRDCLQEQGNHQKYELHWVKDYQSGLKHILSGNYDVYLIDHFLGKDSGLDLLNEAVRAGCKAPMIIVTGQSAREIDQAALMAGATDYLVKGKLDGQLLERSIRYALERSRLQKKIHELAVRDELTGLYNRRELHRFLDYEVLNSRRYNHSFSIMMIDVDHFKYINDRFGHLFGDEILPQVAQILISNTRSCDLQARYGGDEFIIVVPETPARQACICAERIRKAVESLQIQVKLEGGLTEKVDLTISIGVAEYPNDAITADSLVDTADQALYQAKHQGCNRVVRFYN